MFGSAEKFNTPKSLAPEKSKEEKHQRETLESFKERSVPLTRNEKQVLNNLQKMVAWFEDDVLKELNDKKTDPDLVRYLAEFENQVQEIEKPASESEILKEIIKSDVVFLGDYHHLRKSQEFVADILKQVSQKSSRSIVLTIEFIEHSRGAQKALDDYMSGKIEEKKFLKKINFKHWDNPEHWPAYKKILEIAKQMGIRVYGLNTTRKEKTLDETDKILAKNLEDIIKKNPKSLIVAQIGESHLSGNHLPKKMAALETLQSKKTITIFQNLTNIYFEALKKYKNFHTPKILKLKGSSYNIITAPLITRLVSDIEYLQFNDDPQQESKESLPEDISYKLAQGIEEMLGLKKRVNSHERDIPPIYSDSFLINAALKNLKQNQPEKIFQQYIKVLKEKGSVYVPGSASGKFGSFIIIERFRLKRVLEELAKFIANPEKKIEDFENLSPQEQKNLRIFQYICSKVFIPERIPTNEEENIGEQIFLDFLAGKKINLSQKI